MDAITMKAGKGMRMEQMDFAGVKRQQDVPVSADDALPLPPLSIESQTKLAAFFAVLDEELP